MTPKEQLRSKLADRSAVVGIYGLGYVGLPLALRFAEVGYPVLGFDIDKSKVEALAVARSYIEHIRLDKPLPATTDFSRTRECDALIVCVPTPLNAYREPDLSFVLNTVEAIAPYLRTGQVLSLESTTYPGTTEEELRPRIEARGLEVGRDAFLCFSPEREDPGNPEFVTRTIPKVVGGSSAACLEVALALYGQVIDRLVAVSSTRAAEMTKLLENIHRAVNIGLANEMKIICDRMGIDVHEVIRAAATKPFGFVPYWPGPGLGGHCIPIDPFYLTWKAREYGLHTRFIELAGEINRAMPEWVVGKIMEALNDRGKALKGSRVLVLGIAYKKNVNDMRESPAVELMEMLARRGAGVEYSDPHVPVFPRMRQHHFDLKSVVLSPQALSEFDLVLLATNHDAFDYRMIGEHSKLIVDTRGVYLEPAANVVKA
jgi:UDP-N-acetyl-D-glucosamine dehydrogenase